MAQTALDEACFSKDAREFLFLLNKHKVRYLLVGGNAVIFYGYARLTGDMDFFYDLAPRNVQKLYAALLEFWKGRIPGIRHADELLRKGLVVQFGVPPNRIDLVNQISGVTFERAWTRRVTARSRWSGISIPVCYIGISDLIANKKAAGRSKDLDDLRYLRQTRSIKRGLR